MSLDSAISPIYNYINTLSNKIVTPNLVDPMNIKNVISDIQKVLPKYLSSPSNPESNVWPFYEFVKFHPVIFNGTLMFFTAVPLADNTFLLQLYCLHSVSVISTMLHNTYKKS